jgi:hypothetical protein
VNRYGLGGAGVRVLSQRGKAKEGLGKVKRAAGTYILLLDWQHPPSTLSLEPWTLETGYGGRARRLAALGGRELTTLALAESLIAAFPHAFGQAKAPSNSIFYLSCTATLKRLF